MPFSAQELGQFFGYVIVVIAAHWVTRGDLKTTLRALQGAVEELTLQLATMRKDVTSHERRITSLEGRLDTLWMLSRADLPDKVEVNLTREPKEKQ